MVRKKGNLLTLPAKKSVIMMRLSFSTIVFLLFLASCSGVFNQGKSETDNPATNTPVPSGVEDTSKAFTTETPASGIGNDSSNQAEQPGLKVKLPVGQQKLDNSPEIRNTAEFHYKRGLVLFKISKYDEGIKEFDTVIRMDPKMGKAYINRGTALMEIKRYKEAAGDFEKAIGLSSNDSTAYLNLGLSYFYIGDFKASIEANTKLIGLTPHDPIAFYNRGISYGQLKDYKSAIGDFDQAIRLKPTYNEAYFNRGLAYYFSGNKETACQDWEMAKQYGSSKAATVIEEYCR